MSRGVSPRPTASFGVNSMVEPLRHVLIQSSTEAFGSAFENPDHGYIRPVDLQVALREHDAFGELLTSLGVAVHELGGESTSPDLIYTYDASLVTPHGAILLRSGKESRRGEEMVHRDWYEQAGIPVVGQINAPGTVDGGDVMWLANDTMAIGRSLRTNTSGIEQLRVLLSSTSTSATTISVFDVPVHGGAAACLHLMSSISMVSDHLAVVELPLLPSGLFRLLQDLEVELIEIQSSEVDTLAGNVLAIRPGVVVS